ncbi:MAG TPA: hypothetical protein H9964_08105 [Candidatus Gallimonas intestinavium]|uniref:Uncharacterized protein n=1 Tax=Candidatus Gallimonas intestinavium TaxID=2838603 RepID=A0A9D2G5H3_9FIRM|nr:hypothetical protein [Candidatus Gallimonas intestinavium]
MEKKEKSSKRSAKLIVVLIALLLIACSLLGFTLARYITEERDGQGGVNIAQWNIGVEDATTEGAGTVTAMLSPAMEEYNNETHSSTGRTHTVAADGSKGLVITNNSDVAAIVTITITDGLKYYKNDGSGEEATTPTGSAETNPEWQGVTLSQIIHPKLSEGQTTSNYEGFTVNAYKADGTKDEGPYTDKDQSDTTVTYEITLEAKGGKLEVLIGEIIWETDLTSDTDDNRGPYGDARDTWIGENVGSVGFAYSWSAVQGSQIPTNP